MTDQPASPAQAAAAPDRQPVQPSKGPAQADPSVKAAELQEQLDAIRATAAAERGALITTVRVKPPHDSFSRGGITVTRDPTPVPGHALALLLGAAADAGVTIEEA